jgi:hypothetical protein
MWVGEIATSGRRKLQHCSALTFQQIRHQHGSATRELDCIMMCVRFVQIELSESGNLVSRFPVFPKPEYYVPLDLSFEC